MMEHQLKKYVRTEFLSLTPRELLQAAPATLLGVSKEAELDDFVIVDCSH